MRESKSRALPLGYTPINEINGVSSGIRTHDFQSHNLALYQLNYTHHISNINISIILQNQKMVRQKGFEPLTLALEGRCSIQLSYWRIILERVMGIGPTQPAWKAGALPLCYTRTLFAKCIYIITLKFICVNNFLLNF